MTAASAALDNRLLVACGLAWSAALIHLEAAVGHLGEYALYAGFFEVLAFGQLAWGVLVYRRPTARLLAVGAAASLAVVVLWVVSRTVGLPIGPVAWRPEGVGLADVLASADEVALALLVVARSARLRWLGPVGSGLGVCLMLMSSLALVPGAHVH